MEIGDAILTAMRAKANARERNHQIGLGPSEYGHCREYVRNVMIGTPQQPNDEWPGAAEIGTMIGEYVEQAAARHLGAMTQVPVTTTLPNGLVVSGTADIVLREENALVDVKTKDNLAGIRKDGPSIDNCIQVSIYTLGLVQRGVLKEGATAHLIYIDRSGVEQVVYEVSMEWETILTWIERCIDRLTDVMDAQDHVDVGEVEWARALRDKTPPYCYSPRVMCPFRDLCWAGSEWKPTTEDSVLTGEIADIVHRFVEARDDEKQANARRMEYREALREVSGITEDGFSVNWAGPGGNALFVTQVNG